MRRLKLPNRPTKASRLVFGVVFILFAVYAVSLIYPFIWAFFASLKGVNEYFERPFALPENWMFSNYAEALKNLSVNGTSYFRMTWNSIWMSCGNTLIGIFSLTIFSYTMAKYEFRGRGLLDGLNMFVMLIPIVGSMPATYRLLLNYGIMNTPLMMITSTGAFGGSYLIMRSFFQNLSWSYAEAALIDGANDFSVFFKVMCPMALPFVFAMILMRFIEAWNDYLGPLLYMEDYPTLASGLYTYRSLSVERYGMYPVYFAGILVAMIPVLILYTVFHNTIMDHMLGGGLKG